MALDKKFEFDLKIKDNPREILREIIERAGYTYGCENSGGDVDACVATKEQAKSKEDVFKFIEDVNKVTGLELEILYDEDEIDEMGEVDFHTEDGMFGGIISFKGNDVKGTNPSVEDCCFQLAYSEEGLIFN